MTARNTRGRRSARPSGYWNDFANLERELRAYMAAPPQTEAAARWGIIGRNAPPIRPGGCHRAAARVSAPSTTSDSSRSALAVSKLPADLRRA